jgi:hypothetical protein
MQQLGQKGRQVGLRDAAPERALGPADANETCQQVRPEFLDRVGAAIGELSLRPGPHGLVRVQFGCVGGKVLDPQPGEGGTQLANGRALVDLSTIPEDDDGASQVAKQMPEVLTDLRLADVLEVQAEVESKPTAPRAHRDSRDDGDPVVALPEPQDRRLTARGPGPADARDEQEAGFVYEDEVGAQPRGVFFIRGHSVRFHRATASSSRWSARLSGFCGVQPSLCMRRPT